MIRIALFFRARAFPLLALFGIALLLGGVFEYWRFYRDLYVEELNALRTLDSFGEVAYLRSGSPGSEWTWGLDDAPPIPLTTPLAGRLEAISVYVDGSLPAKDWERAATAALRLPGMKTFEDRFPDDVSTTNALDLRRTLGASVPAFDPPVEEQELDEPFPRGEPIDAEEAKTIFSKTLESWKAHADWEVDANDGFDRPFLAILHDGTQRIAELRDGNRIWEYSAYADDPFDEPPDEFLQTVALTENGIRQTLKSFGDEWRIVAREPDEERSNEPHLGGSQRRIGFGELPNGHQVSDLHKTLESTGVERIDEVRYRMTFAPGRVVVHERAILFSEIEVVVRLDRDFAIERCRLKHRNEGHVGWTIVDEIRRLRQGGGRTFWTERLTRTVRDYDGADPYYERDRFAVSFNPQNYSAAFDLGTYGLRPWPDPAPLPQLRSYRILFPAGIVALALGTVGSFFRRIRTRPRRGERVRLPALRFGLVTLGAATLLTISLAGWYKSKLDVAEEEAFLLGDGGWSVRTERHEPGFPLSLLTTEAHPIGAPLKLVGVGEPEVPIRDRLLKLPWLERFEGAGGRSQLLPSTLSAAKIGTPHATPTLRIQDADFDQDLPPGETLSAKETREVAGRMFAAWQRPAEPFGEPYCVASEWRAYDDYRQPYVRTRLELRDGDRSWKAWAESYSMPGDTSFANVECSDGAWRFLYGRRERDPLWPDLEAAWTLAARRRAHDEWEPYQVELLSSSPFPNRFAWLGCDGVGERMIGALQARSVRLNVLDCERLDESRYRFELEPPRILFGQLTSPSFVNRLGWTPCVVARWLIVANEALDWAVERSEIETIEGERDSKPNQREALLTLCRYERIGDRTLLVECRTRESAAKSSEEQYPGRFYSYAWAYDFAPTIDERIFRLPSLDYPHPPPDPVPPPVFAWWMATTLVACGGFTFAGIGRARDAIRRRRDERVAQDPNAQDEDQTSADEQSAAEGGR